MASPLRTIKGLLGLVSQGTLYNELVSLQSMSPTDPKYLPSINAIEKKLNEYAAKIDISPDNPKKQEIRATLENLRVIIEYYRIRTIEGDLERNTAWSELHNQVRPKNGSDPRVKRYLGLVDEDRTSTLSKSARFAHELDVEIQKELNQTKAVRNIRKLANTTEMKEYGRHFAEQAGREAAQEELRAKNLVVKGVVKNINAAYSLLAKGEGAVIAAETQAQMNKIMSGQANGSGSGAGSGAGAGKGGRRRATRRKHSKGKGKKATRRH
jgi:hypothetical protein